MGPTLGVGFCKFLYLCLLFTCGDHFVKTCLGGVLPLRAIAASRVGHFDSSSRPVSSATQTPSRNLVVGVVGLARDPQWLRNHELRLNRGQTTGFAVMDAVIDADINILDTNVYGGCSRRLGEAPMAYAW
jgi:hypothetical protein